MEGLILFLWIAVIVCDMKTKLYSILILLSYYTLHLTQHYFSLEAYIQALVFCAIIPTLLLLHFTKGIDYVATISGLITYILCMVSFSAEIPYLSSLIYEYFDGLNKTFVTGTVLVLTLVHFLNNRDSILAQVQVTTVWVTMVILYLFEVL